MCVSLTYNKILKLAKDLYIAFLKMRLQREYGWIKISSYVYYILTKRFQKIGKTKLQGVYFDSYIRNTDNIPIIFFIKDVVIFIMLLHFFCTILSLFLQTSVQAIKHFLISLLQQLYWLSFYNLGGVNLLGSEEVNLKHFTKKYTNKICVNSEYIQFKK